MLKKYNKFLSERFGPNFNESDFQEKQFDTMEEKMMYQKKKLQDQDDMIEFMIGVNNENRQITREMGNNISKQNSLLDKVNKDIDNLNDKMNKSNLKVTNFLAKSSYCRLYVIAIVQALIIIWLIL
jgi:phage terminase large subunit-like protein